MLPSPVPFSAVLQGFIVEACLNCLELLLVYIIFLTSLDLINSWKTSRIGSVQCMSFTNNSLFFCRLLNELKTFRNNCNLATTKGF